MLLRKINFPVSSSIEKKSLQRGNAAIGALIFFGCVAAWFTHLYTCFTDERWGFLIAGAIFFPIAIVHGVGIWFGIW